MAEIIIEIKLREDMVDEFVTKVKDLRKRGGAPSSLLGPPREDG